MMRGGYLKVLTPVTTNGVNPVMTEDGKLKYKESHLHISAKRRMENKNAKLPNHLKNIIEVVSNEVAKPAPIQTKVVKQEPTDIEDEEDDETEDSEGNEESPVVKKRGGRKKVSNDKV